MIKRTFIPGSEWLYYKIYCGAKTADQILTEGILPLCVKLENIPFFFIRYADPKTHIRFRFKVNNQSELLNIMSEINNILTYYEENSLIWKVQMDSYNREIERYGEHTMELAEELFHVDSLYTMRFLNLIEGTEGEEIRWRYSFSIIDSLLKAFNYNDEQKQNLLNRLSAGFGQEFNINKSLRLQLDKKFRAFRKDIHAFIEHDESFNEEYLSLFNLQKEYQGLIKPITAQIIEEEKKNQNTTLNDLLASYIHMICNRLFKSQQRVHELAVYYMLNKYYTSENARKKKMKN